MYCLVKLSLLLALLYVCSTQGQSPVGNFAVVAFSAQSTSSTGYASNLIPSAPTGQFWNAGYPGQPTGTNDWVSFDLLRLDFTVSQFTILALGDTTHDPKDCALQKGITAHGPWDDVTTFTATPGATALQTFSIPATTSRYWRWRIITRGSVYQTVVYKVNFLGSPTTTPQPLNEFVIASWSTQQSGYVNYLLPTSNPLATPNIAWDPLSVSNAWVVFDLQGASSLHVNYFQFATIGDTTHDVQNFRLAGSASANGPYTTVLTGTGVSGTTAIQSFAVSPAVAGYQYWDFTVTSTYSTYQPVVSYVNFLVSP